MWAGCSSGSASTGKRTPIGYFDGIYATHVRCVRFVNNTNAVAATDNGVYYSTDHGATWNRPTFTYNGGSITGHPSPDWTTGGSGNPVTTIGTCRGVGGLWSTSGPAQDSSQCYIAFHSGSTNYFAVSTDGGASFDVKTTTLGGANDRVIKIIVEGQTHGSSQIVFCGSGLDGRQLPAPTLSACGRSTRVCTSLRGRNIVTGSGITGCEPIDITVRSDGSAKYLVSFRRTRRVRATWARSTSTTVRGTPGPCKRATLTTRTEQPERCSATGVTTT